MFNTLTNLVVNFKKGRLCFPEQELIYLPEADPKRMKIYNYLDESDLCDLMKQWWEVKNIDL